MGGAADFKVGVQNRIRNVGGTSKQIYINELMKKKQESN